MNLSSKAMLASLTIRQWTARKYDKKVSRDVANAHGSDIHMGRYNKSLLAKTALEEIQRVASQARADFYAHTLPWQDDGARVLTSSGYFDLAQKMRGHEGNWQPATERLFDNYDTYTNDARVSLNGLWKAEDYPTLGELRGKFGLDFRVRPLPEAEDFRVNLSSEDVRLIQNQITRSNDAAVKTAMTDVFERIRDVVSAMAGKLKTYKVTEDGVEGIFRDTLVTNVQDLLDVLPSLNLTDDARVTTFAQEMRKLVQYDAETLRESEHTRIQVAASADSILATMSGII